MVIRWRLVLLFGAVLLGAPAIGLAQEDPRYTETRNKARVAFKDGQFEEAAMLFREAFDLSPKANLLYNIGYCYEKSGKTAQAVSFYERFVQAAPTSPKRPAVQRKIVELKRGLEGQYETVRVDTDPSGAIIFVDDKAKGAMGEAPTEFRLIPGDYTIIAEMEGHEPVKKLITLQAGRPADVSLSLIPKGQMGSVTLLVSERGANILIDKRKVGQSPLTEPVRLRAGPHEILVMMPGFGPWKRDIRVKAGSTERIKVELSAEGGGLARGGSNDDVGVAPSGGGGSSGPTNIWPWVTMGVGAAALAGGAFTGFRAQDLHDQLDEKRKNDDLIAASDIDVGNNLVLMTNVLLGVGAAAVIGGAAWWLLGDSGVETGGSISGLLGVDPDGAPTVGVLGTF